MGKLLKKLLNYYWFVLIMILLISSLFFISIKENSKMETDLDKYMPQSHPDFVYSNQAEEWFNIKDGIIIAIEKTNGIYNSQTLEKVKSLTKELQKMDEIQKSDVTSLYTADNIIGSEWGLEVDPFYIKVPQTETDLQKLQYNVKQNDMIFKRIVSEDERITLIISEIDDNAFSQDFYNKIKMLASKYEGPERIYVAGRPIVEGSLAALAPADMVKMVPIVILVIIGVLFLIFKSFKATIFTLLVVLFSIIWSFGLMAFLDIPIYAVSTMLPVMLIAIGVADGIHLFNHLKINMLSNPGIKKRDVISSTIQSMWKPVIMTSVTTAIGFVSLLTSQVYPIKYFGIFTAFGVLMAMVFSLVFIPAALMIFGLPNWKKNNYTKHKKNSGKFSLKFTKLLLKFKTLSIISTALIVSISIWGMTRVWVDSSFISMFDKNSAIVLTDNYINQNFGGTSTLNVIFDSENANTFKQPQVLKIMDKIQFEVVNSLEVVGNSFALTNYIKRMNMVMNSDNKAFDIIPNSQELIGQYLLLYEMSGDPQNLTKVVDYNYKKSNLMFQLKSDTSLALNSTISMIKKYEPNLNKLGVSIKYAGSGYKALVFSDLILKGQITSIIISLLLIIILLSFMFKNIMIGLIGSVPIIITAFISFGIMGIFKIPLSTTTALLSSIAIGIGIDYAVHFIEQYIVLAKSSDDKIRTLELTMNNSGRAILYNAIVVIAGFLVLLFSLFPGNRTLGTLVSLNMITSFIGTITIMAVLLNKSNIFFNKKSF